MEGILLRVHKNLQKVFTIKTNKPFLVMLSVLLEDNLKVFALYIPNDYT